MTSVPILDSHPATEVKGRNVISVASGKGGVGKTWFSITLAHELARNGSRILLFDGDLGLANVDIQLGLTPQQDLASVLARGGRIEDALIKYTEAGFDIIAGHSGSATLASLSAADLTGLRDSLFRAAAGYDRAIVDLAAGVDAPVRIFAAGAATKLVVTTDEPTSLTDAYAFIKLTAGRAPGADLRIVVNMAGTEAEGQHTYQTLLKACKSFLGISPPLAGIIRRDRHVRDAIRHQVPLLTRSPNCDAATDIAAIARSLTKR